MKKKIFIVAISFVLVVATSFVFAFVATTKVNVANAGNLANISFKVYCENINHILNDAQPIIANKQMGIYFENYPANCKVILKGTDGSQTQKSIVNNRVEVPIKNNVTIRAYLLLNGPIFPELDIGISVTYDVEKPNISATTVRAEVKNGETVIGKTVTVQANDNSDNVKLYMTINGGAEVLCKGATYNISDDGKYTFYAIDIANNYSEDFTITYYNQAPEEVPTNPSKPTIPDDSEPIASAEENFSINQKAIIVVVIIGSIILGVVVSLIVYKRQKAKANASQFDDDE